MYEYIYEEMVDAQIASPRENPVYMDRTGNEVEGSERFGLAQELKIDYPDYILFADESGCQTNQSRMEMWATENTLSSETLHLKSSAALQTTGLPFYPLLLDQVKLSAV
jgi:hypothetical protein